ncbi:3-oxoacid CoA-transferase [Fonticula alba]|uniref:Succinyl-CoA:3-ketoacid-coenzyme A transferase n=1 Tax=Fonticula alba TaxID=691883 RepID=A0A058Z0F7_FONAL|nr:3-oxoacid CoA-transferase [Fonticula alba]KCV67611.1 3-oxoacid CoA-transferase [Fonticula alba]|eukprot:XP_009497949.1 3-oxoacid CoA-transferase [Fonticula alba]
MIRQALHFSLRSRTPPGALHATASAAFKLAAAPRRHLSTDPCAPPPPTAAENAAYRAPSKVFPNAAATLQGVLKDGQTVLMGGFGVNAIPEHLIDAVQKTGVKDLVVVSNNAGVADFGIGKLMQSRQLRRMIASYVGENKLFEELYMNGELEVELTPQGTLAERLRAAGAGIPAFYTPTGNATLHQRGGIPIKFAAGGGAVEIASEPREVRTFGNRSYVLEHSLPGDVALIKAWKADTLGNLVFRGVTANFNGPCARAARICIAEVEEIVEPGQLDPNEIHVPGIYVHRVFRGDNFIKPIEKLRYHTEKAPATTPAEKMRERIARRAAKELRDGMYVNLGIGMPTRVPNYVPEGVHVLLQSENGCLGLGPYPHPGEEDPDIINAGKESVTLIPGASAFDSAESFGMIRAGKLDITILGGMEVSPRGDLANWVVPGAMVKGMGGAMDLVSSGSRVVVCMEHTTRAGTSKVVPECTLPITGAGVVSRLITELAVFDIDRKQGGFILRELAPGVTLEEVRAKTAAPFRLPEGCSSVPHWEE